MKKTLLICIGILGLTTMVGCASVTQDGDSQVQFVESSEVIVESSTESVVESGVEQSTEVVAESVVEKKIELADGVYQAKFDTDSGMFHVNEANEGLGILTVANGEATIHVSLASVNILNLYPGLAEDAQKDGAVLLQPTTDVVTYSDGTSEEVFGFDIPVPYLDEEFDVALVGKKGTWYDHKVSVSDPVLAE